MRLRVKVEVLEDDPDIVLAEGVVTGELDLKKGNPDGQPILTIRMRHILDFVRETIYADSNA